MRLQGAVFMLEDALLGPSGPRPGAEQFLSILKMEGVWMYAAGGVDRPAAEAALRRAGLSGFFRGVLTAAEAGTEELLLNKCLTRLRCRREECVVFTGALSTARTARAAGFRVAAVEDPARQAEQPELRALAEYRIRSYGEWFERGE